MYMRTILPNLLKTARLAPKGDAKNPVQGMTCSRNDLQNDLAQGHDLREEMTCARVANDQ